MTEKNWSISGYLATRNFDEQADSKLLGFVFYFYPAPVTAWSEEFVFSGPVEHEIFAAFRKDTDQFCFLYRTRKFSMDGVEPLAVGEELLSEKELFDIMPEENNLEFWSQYMMVPLK